MIQRLLLFPAAHDAHAQRIGAGMDRDGAADLQQAHLALCGGVLGTQGGAGLHPEPFALFNPGNSYISFLFDAANKGLTTLTYVADDIVFSS